MCPWFTFYHTPESSQLFIVIWVTREHPLQPQDPKVDTVATAPNSGGLTSSASAPLLKAPLDLVGCWDEHLLISVVWIYLNYHLSMFSSCSYHDYIWLLFRLLLYFFSLLSLLVLLYHMFVMHCRFLYVIIMISGFYDQCCVSSKVLCNDVCDVFFFVFTDVEFLLYLSIVFEHISLQCSFMGGHNVFGPSKRDAHQREWNVHQPISGILGATWMF